MRKAIAEKIGGGQFGIEPAQLRAFLKDPDAWLQHRDPDGEPRYLWPHVAHACDFVWQDRFYYEERVTERKRASIARAFAPLFVDDDSTREAA